MTSFDAGSLIVIVEKARDWLNRPKLKIEFDEHADFEVKFSPDVKGYGCRFRVRVKNTGRRTAKRSLLR